MKKRGLRSPDLELTGLEHAVQVLALMVRAFRGNPLKSKAERSAVEKVRSSGAFSSAAITPMRGGDDGVVSLEIDSDARHVVSITLDESVPLEDRVEIVKFLPDQAMVVSKDVLLRREFWLAKAYLEEAIEWDHPGIFSCAFPKGDFSGCEERALAYAEEYLSRASSPAPVHKPRYDVFMHGFSGDEIGFLLRNSLGSSDFEVWVGPNGVDIAEWRGCKRFFPWVPHRRLFFGPAHSHPAFWSVLSFLRERAAEVRCAPAMTCKDALSVMRAMAIKKEAWTSKNPFVRHDISSGVAAGRDMVANKRVSVLLSGSTFMDLFVEGSEPGSDSFVRIRSGSRPCVDRYYRWSSEVFPDKIGSPFGSKWRNDVREPVFWAVYDYLQKQAGFPCTLPDPDRVTVKTDPYGFGEFSCEEPPRARKRTSPRHEHHEDLFIVPQLFSEGKVAVESVERIAGMDGACLLPGDENAFIPHFSVFQVRFKDFVFPSPSVMTRSIQVMAIYTRKVFGGRNVLMDLRLVDGTGEIGILGEKCVVNLPHNFHKEVCAAIEKFPI